MVSPKSRNGEGCWHASEAEAEKFQIESLQDAKAIMTPKAEAHSTMVHMSQEDTIQYWGPY